MRKHLIRSIRHTGPSFSGFSARAALIVIVACALMPVLATQSANAQRLENLIAVFAALDKVTAKIRRLEIPLNETVEFGAIKVTPRVCYSRPPTERPKTTSFVQIDETELDGSQKRIFSGWMFAQSPGLHALEHPVYDIWLTSCGKPENAPADAATTTDAANDAAKGDKPPPIKRKLPRRRVRR